MSDTKEKSPTGSLRYNTGKLPMHHVPPMVIEQIAEVLQHGAEKYEELNWEKGNYISVPYASAMRHMLKFWSGEDLDQESGKKHLSHVLTNIMFMLYYMEHYPQYDDRAFKKKDK